MPLRRGARRFLLLLPICILVGLLFLYNEAHRGGFTTSEIVKVPSNFKSLAVEDSQSLLDGCYHVYLDVGSNVGVQVRKLFQPQQYPNAPILPLFDKEFGKAETRKERVCAVGFEPNPHHTEVLSGIEKSYHSCGWRAWMMTETGVSNRSGYAQFYSDGAMAHKEWGGGILSPDVNNIALESQKSAKPIKLVRLSQFLLETVGRRKLPPSPKGEGPPRVLIKMDIEGSEIDVLPDILFNGGLSAVNCLMIEFHERLEKLPIRKEAHKKLNDILKQLSSISQNLQGSGYDFSIVNIDDETYGTSDEPLPQC